MKTQLPAMDAAPILIRVARVMREIGLEAVMIGNPAAALQGAPETTVDVDFLFRKTPANLRKLKKLARRLEADIFEPYFPHGDSLHLFADDLALQLNFLKKQGWRMYHSVDKIMLRLGVDEILVEPLRRKVREPSPRSAPIVAEPDRKRSKKALASRRARTFCASALGSGRPASNDIVQATEDQRHVLVQVVRFSNFPDASFVQCRASSTPLMLASFALPM